MPSASRLSSKTTFATLLSGIVATIFAACSATSQPPPPPSATAIIASDAAPTETPAAASHSAAGGVELRGAAIQINTGYDVLETYVPMLQEIAELGANTVLLSTAGYMEHAKSQAIFLDSRRAPNKPDLIALIREAHKRRLKVLLMPIVLLSHPHGSEWRGVIEPPDWPDWWRQYRDFIRHFADVAADSETEMLLIGSELVSTEKQTAEWVKTIEIARDRFRKGKLGYSANWDHYDPVKFWDKLDFIGMTSYYTLADRKNPTVEEIVEKWTPIRDEILAWRQKTGKPLILTEVGWCSQEGAAMAPWNYYANQRATPGGLEEQRRLYEAFLRAWSGAPGLWGVIWWEWSGGEGGSSDFGYTPRKKPAEQILRGWFAELSPGSVGGGKAAEPD